MKLTKILMALLLSALLLPSCKSDDDTAEPENCPLSGVLKKLDSTTSIGLFDVTYSDNGRVKTAGLQDYEFSYDANDNITSGILYAVSTLNPQVEYVFSYADNKISSISENWGEAPNIEERYVYTPTYGVDNFVTKLTRVGLGGTVELDYSFDSNGNALIWTDPTFQEVHTYTFGTQKGLVSGLTHNQAFAYGVAIGQPFFHFNNTVTSEVIVDAGQQNTTSSNFSQISYTDAGFQATAIDPDGNQYVFDYDCD